MRACREGFNIFTRLGLSSFLTAWKFKRINWKYVCADSFMPVICFIVGHIPYRPDEVDEPNEIACRRCHRWLR